MTLRVTVQIVGAHVCNGSFVNIAWRDQTGGNEVAQPLCGVGVDLVVVGAHSAATPSTSGIRIACDHHPSAANANPSASRVPVISSPLPH